MIFGEELNIIIILLQLKRLSFQEPFKTIISKNLVIIY